jgi:hypothetical protein
MRSKPYLLALVLAGLTGSGNWARADNVPVVNPDFSAKINSPSGGFTYEGNPYAVGSLIPDHSFVAGVTVDGVLGDSHTGTTITDANGNPASAGLAGYVGSPANNAGILYDTRDFLPGQGPTGPGAFITVPAAGPAAIYQVNSGGAYQPNTIYTFTVEVSDRSAFTPDVISFPTSVDCSLMQDVTEVTGEIQTFTAPPNGGTSVLTLTYTTGALPPPGAIGFVLRASGIPSPALAATQIVFDNVAITSEPVPEPATISMMVLGGLMFTRRRR